ncbi:unnamed protein product [Cyprideis torosa]|uniref:Elongation of very long chain fatty acids protein n=1 Tax=Cyprideis torosa TaxID=163714 RepID=A0A7R8ZH77_9CRUS|nr:unnamed protein product [Cyprideis torosa]CAG0881948.1 unnamed protein product [Cyprideis torosa]
MVEVQMENITMMQVRLEEIYNQSEINLDVWRLPFEDEFDHHANAKWMSENWTVSVWFALAYACLIYFGQKFMKDRPAYNLQKPLEVWNWSLAIFSIMGSIKILPYISAILHNEGFRSSLCIDHHDVEFFRPGVFWIWMFAYSKVVELGDTAFIILRKRPLIFLHWYHHITVLIYTWFSFSDLTPSGLWFIGMNYTVHAFMYTYYSLRSMSVKVPRSVSMTITIMQIVQMVMGCFINYMAYHYRNDGKGCQVSWWNVASSAIMYGSYWVLFCWFFYNAYLVPGGKRREKRHDKVQ